MSTDREAGIGAKDLLLIVLIVALLGVGGTYAYRTYQSTGASAAEKEHVEAYLAKVAQNVRSTGWPWQGAIRCPATNADAAAFWQGVIDGLATPDPGSGVEGLPVPEGVGKPVIAKVEFAEAQSSGRWDAECSVSHLAMRVHVDGTTATGDAAVSRAVVIMKD